MGDAQRMTIFLSSDHHFMHENVIKYCGRPYANADEMNRDMARRWNEVVTPQDTVWYLGDFSLSPQAVERWLKQLNYKEIHLILGNHDKPFKSFNYIEKYLRWGFTSVQTEAYIPYGEGSGFRFKLSHFPYKGTGEDHTYVERYADKRPIDKGEWLLCGHIHEKWKKLNRMINVGVDVWGGYPVSMGTIMSVRNNDDGDNVYNIQPWTAR